MAIIYSISTISDLYDNFSKTTSGAKDFNINADLDFNNEDYYYIDREYFFRTYLDGNCNINGNNHIFSNIYSLNNIVFKILKSGLSTANCCLTIKDLTIEAILNGNGNLFDISGSNSGIYFKNCIFNIKSINNVNIFKFANNCKFIACVFNIEVYNSAKNIEIIYDSSDDDSSSMNVKNAALFESCEFKIRNRSTRDCGIYRSSGDTNGGLPYKKVIYDNSAIFYEVYNNNRWNSLLYLSRTVSNVIITNSCIASFSTKFIGTLTYFSVICNEYINNSSVQCSASFYDNDRIRIQRDSITGYSHTGLVGLSTQECKNKEKLDEIGFIIC